MNGNTALVTTDGRGGSVALANMGDVMSFAETVFKSGLAPQSFKTVQALAVGALMVHELGLPLMNGLRNMMVVNGRPALWGAATLALIRSSGKLKNMKQWYEGDGDKLTAHCEMWRHGQEDSVHCTFSLAEAKAAGLAGKDTWKSYGKDLAMWKAVHRCEQMLFSDVLWGIPLVEEARDYEEDITEQVTITAPPEGRHSVRRVTATEPTPEPEDATKEQEKAQAQEPEPDPPLELISDEDAEEIHRRMQAVGMPLHTFTEALAKQGYSSELEMERSRLPKLLKWIDGYKA